MKKLIAIDLDGTTLNQDSIITDKTAKTLRRAIEDGHSVVIATGRPYRMSKNFYQQLQLTTPMINFNGALVHLPGKKWADEQETSVNRKIVFDVMSEKKNLKLDFIAAENRETFFIDDLNFFDQHFFASDFATNDNLLTINTLRTNPTSVLLRSAENRETFFIDDLNFFDQHFFASDFATNDNLLTINTLRTNPTSVLLRSQPENVGSVSEELKQQFGHEVEVNTWGGPNPMLEVVAKGIQKAHGLKRVINSLNVQQEDILAFGDEHNDVDMLKFAGWGVSMVNGTDQLKSVADDITEKPNSEDGMADYLTKYLNDVDMLKFAGWGVSMVNGTDQLKSVADDITEKPNSEDGMADYLTKYLDL